MKNPILLDLGDALGTITLLLRELDANGDAINEAQREVLMQRANALATSLALAIRELATKEIVG